MLSRETFTFLLVIFGLILFSSCAHSKYVETRTRIGVIDTGVNYKAAPELKAYACAGGHLGLADSPFVDKYNHGTRVLRILFKKLSSKKYCFIMVNYYNSIDSGWVNLARMIDGYKYLASQNIKYLNVSSSGIDYSYNEYRYIDVLVKQKVYITVAAGNEGLKLDCELTKSYPNCYNFDRKYFRSISFGPSIYGRGNYGTNVDYIDPEFIGGASFNAPKYLGNWILELDK